MRMLTIHNIQFYLHFLFNSCTKYKNPPRPLKSFQSALSVRLYSCESFLIKNLFIKIRNMSFEDIVNCRQMLVTLSINFIFQLTFRLSLNCCYIYVASSISMKCNENGCFQFNERNRVAIFFHLVFNAKFIQFKFHIFQFEMISISMRISMAIFYTM